MAELWWGGWVVLYTLIFMSTLTAVKWSWGFRPWFIFIDPIWLNRFGYPLICFTYSKFYIFYQICFTLFLATMVYQSYRECVWPMIWLSRVRQTWISLHLLHSHDWLPGVWTCLWLCVQFHTVCSILHSCHILIPLISHTGIFNITYWYF